jgi:hypothetical protein
MNAKSSRVSGPFITQHVGNVQVLNAIFKRFISGLVAISGHLRAFAGTNFEGRLSFERAR